LKKDDRRFENRDEKKETRDAAQPPPTPASSRQTTMVSTPWRRLGVAAQELRLAHTLPTGQAFGWERVVGAGSSSSSSSSGAAEWRGCLGDAALALREESVSLECEWRCDASRAVDVEARLRDYVQVETSLAPLYAQWSLADERLAQVATCIEGVRVLRQDPLECLISFICSSNNNIARITLMLRRLRQTLGTPLILPAFGDDVETKLWQFPTLSQLAVVEVRWAL
jgi:N-glycosylase/DNA lyase